MLLIDWRLVCLEKRQIHCFPIGLEQWFPLPSIDQPSYVSISSATCRDTYSLPDFLSVMKGEDESRALCTSEYSDISPLQNGNVAFSSLEGRPSAINFEHSVELQACYIHSKIVF